MGLLLGGREGGREGGRARREGKEGERKRLDLDSGNPLLTPHYPVRAKDYANADFYYGLFYAVYAGTNAAMSLAAGVMVDRLGARVCTFMFLSLCLLGQIVYGLAPILPLASRSQYGVALAARFLFGLGGGSVREIGVVGRGGGIQGLRGSKDKTRLTASHRIPSHRIASHPSPPSHTHVLLQITVAQNAITTEWFRGHELAMAFGCTLTVSRLGSVVNFDATTWVFDTLASSYGVDAPSNTCGATSGNETLHSSSSPSFSPSPSTLPSPSPSPSSSPSPALDASPGCLRALSWTMLTGAALIFISMAAALSFYRISVVAEAEQEEAEANERTALLAGSGDDENTTGDGDLDSAVSPRLFFSPHRVNTLTAKGEEERGKAGESAGCCAFLGDTLVRISHLPAPFW